MVRTRPIALAAALLALAACGGAQSDTQQFIDATPDVAGQTIEVTGDPSEQAFLPDVGGGDVGRLVAPRSLDKPPAWLQRTREAIGYLNRHVRMVLEPVADLVKQSAQGAKNGDTKTFGPKDYTLPSGDTVTMKLVVKKLAAGKFGFKLFAKPQGGADASYLAVLAGHLTRGDLPHRGRGVLGVDLDALKTVAPSFPGQGKLLNAFAHAGDQKVLIYRLKGFTPDASLHAPVSAVFYGHRVMPTRETRVRTAVLADLYDPSGTGTSQDELVLSRLHWIPGTGGLAALAVMGGDIPADHVVLGRACWDASEQEVFKQLVYCQRPASPSTCASLLTDASGNSVPFEGDKTACAAALDVDTETAPAAADDTGVEAGAPASPDELPPTDLPSDF